MKELNANSTASDALDVYMQATRAVLLDPITRKALEAAFLGGMSALLAILSEVPKTDETIEVGLRIAGEITLWYAKDSHSSTRRGH